MHRTAYIYVIVNAIRTPFQGDFLVRVVPRAEALGCFLFVLRALRTRIRKCPNSRFYIQRIFLAKCLRIFKPIESLELKWYIMDAFSGRLFAHQKRYFGEIRLWRALKNERLVRTN